MSPKSLLLSACLITVALAGCAEEAAEPEQDEFTLDEDLNVSEDTGALRGVVVDEAIVPVAGVTVSLQDQDISTTTDEEGQFAIGGLEPGTYFLNVEKLGWQSIQQSVEVVAGVENPPIIKVQIARDPTTQPFVQARQFDGFITCSFSLVAFGIAACSTAGLDDEFLAQYPSDELGGIPEWTQSEMVWESTQAVSDSLTVMYSASVPNQTLYHNYQEAEGPSPQIIAAGYDQNEEFGIGAGSDLIIRVFNAPIEGTDPMCIERPVLGGCTTGLGFTLDQQFTIYTHIFQHFTPDEGWTFIEDGAHPVPE